MSRRQGSSPSFEMYLASLTARCGDSSVAAHLNDERASIQGKDFLVFEPFGESNRNWIRPKFLKMGALT